MANIQVTVSGTGRSREYRLTDGGKSRTFVGTPALVNYMRSNRNKTFTIGGRTYLGGAVLGTDRRSADIINRIHSATNPSRPTSTSNRSSSGPVSWADRTTSVNRYGTNREHGGGAFPVTRPPTGWSSRTGTVTPPPDIPLDDLGLGDLGGALGGATGPSAEELAIAREQNDIARRTALGNLIGELIGIKQADLNAARQANLGVYEAVAPTAVSPEIAAAIGQMFRGINQGGPVPTRGVNVDFGLFGPTDTSAWAGEAERRARSIMGMATGGVVRAATGVQTIQSAEGLGQLFQAIAAAMAGLSGMSDETGMTNNAFLDSLLSAVGVNTGGPGGRRLLQAEGDTAIYIMEPDGVLHHIADPWTFNALGLDWKQVEKVSPAWMASVPKGDRYSNQNMGQVLASWQKPSFKREQWQSDVDFRNRQQGFTEAQAKAEAAANPRRVLESIFLQSGMGVPQGVNNMAQAMETLGTRSPVFNQMAPSPTTSPQERPGGGLSSLAKGGVVRAAVGKTVEGPTILWVGEGKKKEGLTTGTSEIVYAPPGTIVAPWRKGTEPTYDEAVEALQGQLTRMGLGGLVKKAAKKAGGVIRSIGEDVLHTDEINDALGGKKGKPKPKPRKPVKRSADGSTVVPRRVALDDRTTGITAAPVGPRRTEVGPKATGLLNALSRSGGHRSPNATRVLTRLQAGQTPQVRKTPKAKPRKSLIRAATGYDSTAWDRSLFSDQEWQNITDLITKRAKSTQDLLAFFNGGEQSVLTPEEYQAFKNDYQRRQITGSLFPALNKQMTSGAAFNPLGGAAGDLSKLFPSLPTATQVNRLSGTQKGVLDSMLSGGGVDPEDFYQRVQQDFQGFSPQVQGGQRAQVRMGR